jgi:hypothetical protein
MLGKVDHREALAGRGPLEVSPAVLANYNHSHACDYHPRLVVERFDDNVHCSAIALLVGRHVVRVPLPLLR